MYCVLYNMLHTTCTVCCTTCSTLHVHMYKQHSIPPNKHLSSSILADYQIPLQLSQQLLTHLSFSRQTQQERGWGSLRIHLERGWRGTQGSGWSLPARWGKKGCRSHSQGDWGTWDIKYMTVKLGDVSEDLATHWSHRTLRIRLRPELTSKSAGYIRNVIVQHLIDTVARV